MSLESIISKTVSYQPNAWSPLKTPKSIRDIVKFIKHGKNEKEISILRNYLKAGEQEKYDSHKKRLPGVTFCAEFETHRRRDSIKVYHELIVIDIDKLDENRLKEVLEFLRSDEYVFTYWLSPSGKGIKGLVSLEYQFDYHNYGIDLSHKTAFLQLGDYFKRTYDIEIDSSGSDTTRLCFLSSDKELVFKENIVPYPVSEDIEKHKTKTSPQKKPRKSKSGVKEIKNVLYNPEGKNSYSDRSTLIKIIKYLRSSNQSITNSYDEWLRVALAIANSFTYDVGLRLYKNLCELDVEKYDEEACQNMLEHCFLISKGEINFETILYMAQEKGFELNVKRGSSS